MRPVFGVILACLAGGASAPVSADLAFQQADLAGVSSERLLETGTAEIARRLGVPEADLAGLKAGRARVLEGMSRTEQAAYDYFKRFYPGDFEADFVADFTPSFATNYEAAWSKINLEGDSVTMGTGFSHADLSTRVPSGERLPQSVRLVIDPRSDFAPRGLRRGADRSMPVVFFTDDGQRWSLDLSDGGRNEWQVDTPTVAGTSDALAVAPASIARAGDRLVGVSQDGTAIWLSEDDGARWRRIARNDPAFDEARKDVLRDKGFDDAALRRRIVAMFEAAEDREMPSAEEIEDLIWNRRREVRSIVSFRPHLADPDRVYVAFARGGLGLLRLDDLAEAGDTFATETTFISVPFAEDWNGEDAPVADFAVREVDGTVPGRGAATMQRTAAVLPEHVRPRNIARRDADEFAAWQRDVLDNWGPSTVAIFNDDDSFGALDRTTAPEFKPRFTGVFHGGDGQIVFALGDAGRLYYAVDVNARAFDFDAYDLARARASGEVERAREAFNAGVAAAKEAGRALPTFRSGFAEMRTYAAISRLHWTQLDRDIMAAAGTRSGAWVLLHSGRMRHYQAPELAAAAPGSLRPSADELLDLKAMLGDAIQERDLLGDQMRVHLAAIEDARRLALADAQKYRLALRLESGGFTSKTTTVGGSDTATGDAILGGVAALASEAPFAATFLNLANFALGQARQAADTPRVIENPQAAGFTALQALSALATELKTAYTEQEQAIRFSRQVCLSTPRTRAACLDPGGMTSQPAEPLRASGYATQYLPAAFPQNIMQARYVSMVRQARHRARCLMWTELLPRVGFLYGGALTPGYRNNEVDDRDTFTGTDDGTPFRFGLLGSDTKSLPILATIATPDILNKITVATAWSLRIGTKDINDTLVRTEIDGDGFAGDFAEGPVVLPLEGPGTLSLGDIFLTCGREAGRALFLSLDRLTTGVRAIESFTVNGGKSWSLPLLAEDYGFPTRENVRENLFSPDSLTGFQRASKGIAIPVAEHRFYFGGDPVWLDDWQRLAAFEDLL
ncbi:hypothetical protein SAMN05444722_3438 [Rhodovulum sp. ES.010]|uniref:hypothetical protein n=1 Tax=Rhodovulum sp. ES.010 TaxID=1882821 RepID=UPI0009289C64|nr:hypothetical protein [Rhodovulum sp. ES.010]SIO54940.1 hypothetical protein SAMN05444722_3438 [Rhodovulum sp. ES.010]